MEAVSRIISNNKYLEQSTKSMISIPISIPKNNSYSNLIQCEEYSLTCNNFNPNKMSPPDHWKERLQKRLINYNCVTGFNEKNK